MFPMFPVSEPEPEVGLRIPKPGFPYWPTLTTFGGNPGGADKPGGGPLAVENAPGDIGDIPFTTLGPDPVNGVEEFAPLPG